MTEKQNGRLLKDLGIRLDLGSPGSAEYNRNYQYLRRLSRHLSPSELETHASMRFGKHRK